jgi:16S rRNA (guanine527-N7)-methyltransferase
MNLTALDLENPGDRDLERLLVEPMVASEYILAGTRWVIDVGSGGGSPAIPLRAVLPGGSMTLVESRVRKAVFLKEIVRILSLSDTEVVSARCEAVAWSQGREGTADAVTVRAVRLNSSLVNSIGRLLRPGGSLLLFGSKLTSLPSETATPKFTLQGHHRLLPSSEDRLAVFRRDRDLPVG